MDNPKVSIIVSTYNGEKYIKEQIDSLLNQKYKNIDIYVRDDGSKDATPHILKEYKEKYPNIKIYLENNIGVVGSFFNCLKKAIENSEYFAFCDQDDIWHNDKIEKAINKLKTLKDNKPKLYFSEFNYCDEKMKYDSTSKMNRKGYNFRNSLVECVSSGNTMLFDKKMAELILENDTNDICLHDWWVYMLATSLGSIIYDPEPSLEYRRTGNNVTPGGGGFLKLQFFRIKKFLVSDYFKNIRKQIKKFNYCYYDKVSEEDKKLLDLFNTQNYNIKNTLKKVMWPKYFRQKKFDEILIRCMFLIGKI